MNLVRATATIGGLTLVSRVLGFVRDMLMARFVGAGFASDAFLIAFRLPNLFRALFAEGAFASAFVPMFNRTIGQHRDELSAGLRFAEDVLSVLLPVLALFTAAMMALAGPIVWAMTGGFPDGGPDKLALATEFTRITFPYLFLISLVSLLGGILNSLHRFWVNAAAPVLLNLCLIGGLLFFRGHSDVETARTQSIAVTVSGVLQLAWLVWSCRRAGVRLRLKAPRLTPEVKALLRIVWPAALGAGAVQFNLLVSTALAARFLEQGSVSYLYYADRLNQLPLGLIGIGIGTAMLPSLSRQIARDEDGLALHTQNRAIELALLLTLPAAAALMVSATPIIRALLQHGAFTVRDTVASAAALAAFSIGLPAYVLIKVLTPGFYARADTKTPVRIALVAMLVNLACNLALIAPMAHVGLALSTAISAWVNAGLLYRTLRRRGHFAMDARLKARGARLVAATAAMAAVLVLLNPLVDPFMAKGFAERVIGLALLMAAGAAVYFAAAFALGAFRLADLRAQLTAARRLDRGGRFAESRRTMSRRIVSGIQPTGNLHLGNYLGAIRNWVRMQDEAAVGGGECFFFLADLHALSTFIDPATLAAGIREMAAALIAAGVDPGRATLFRQSKVAAHAELQWLLNGTARIGWLNRMTQFKDKSGKNREGASVALYTYPVLQAADVLAYRATHVPVGDDQKQHLELARDIAVKFNTDYGVELFTLPEPTIPPAAARIMSLRDGTAKMSKSDPSDMSRINLGDDADLIAQKLRKAKTDPDPLPDDPALLEGRPEAKNLVGVYAALADEAPGNVLARFAGQGFGAFKPALAELVVETLRPITARLAELSRDPAELDRLLALGAERAAATAAPTLAAAYRAVGLG